MLFPGEAKPAVQKPDEPKSNARKSSSGEKPSSAKSTSDSKSDREKKPSTSKIPAEKGSDVATTGQEVVKRGSAENRAPSPSLSKRDGTDSGAGDSNSAKPSDAGVDSQVLESASCSSAPVQEAKESVPEAGFDFDQFMAEISMVCAGASSGVCHARGKMREREREMSVCVCGGGDQAVV